MKDLFIFITLGSRSNKSLDLISNYKNNKDIKDNININRFIYPYKKNNIIYI